MFIERLKALRAKSGLTQSEVAAELTRLGCPVKRTTIANWENGRRCPTAIELIKLTEVYQVHSMSELTGNRTTGDSAFMSGLNKFGREHVLSYIELLKENPMFTSDSVHKKQRVLKLYDLPVSAGTGSYLDGSGYTEITVGDLAPAETDYAVKVQGQSMEPKYYDGQILFVKEQQTLNDGEIGIFLLNSDAFVKRLVKDTLVSLNPKYKPIQLGEFDDIRILGKVLGAN